MLFVSLSLAAQSPSGAILGKVTDAAGNPQAKATVTLVEQRRSVTTGDDGSFRFDGVSDGHYHLRVQSRELGSAIAEANVESGTPVTIDIPVDPGVHAEAIVVTAGPARRASEVFQPVAVLDGEELIEHREATLGETLNEQPGVSSTYFGPGASRPVIRGLGGDRIRILQDGVGASDASNVSPDHAVSLDPGAARQIEVVRGPATLLYGSNAVGGVVNVLDGRIPDRVPDSAVTGTIDLNAGSVADERGGAVDLDGGSGALAWHLGYGKRETDDYEIPEGGENGVQPNTALESENKTGGLSLVGKRGYLGVSWNEFDTNYGNAAEEEVTIDLQQKRFDLKGQLDMDGLFRSIHFKVGKTDYEHTEVEGVEVGTKFLNDATEGRLEATHRPLGGWTGTMGLQYSTSDFEAIGEEAFVPPTTTDAIAAFFFEERSWGPWSLQAGGRFESQDLEAHEEGLPSRSFDGFSGSLGTIYRPNEAWSVALSLASAVRIPTQYELYANGPHVGTGTFEIGDVNLDEEKSLGVDLSIRKIAGKFRGELTFFNNEFNGYIYDSPTGELEDDLPVFVFVQEDARFRGVELDTHTEVLHAGENHLELEAGADYVRATLDAGGDLPRISPMRIWGGLRYIHGPFSASAEARHTDDQNDVAENETPTEGYTMFNATLGYRFYLGSTAHDILVRGNNLTDELARNHVSTLKDVAPLPGRDISVSYRLTF
jgi:iron complex outermembrane receptor protein